MSFYLSDKQLRDWAESTLHGYLPPRDYPGIFSALRSPRHTQRLKRVELGLLKVLLDRYRPERTIDEHKRYAESNAVKVAEVADVLHCNVTTVSRAKNRINKLVQDGARKNSDAKKHGLILFHGMGIFFHATFWDAMHARDFSELQKRTVSKAHTDNILLSDEKKHGVRVDDERVNQFTKLSPREQEILLQAARSMRDDGKDPQ